MTMMLTLFHMKQSILYLVVCWLVFPTGLSSDTLYAKEDERFIELAARMESAQFRDGRKDAIEKLKACRGEFHAYQEPNTKPFTGDNIETRYRHLGFRGDHVEGDPVPAIVPSEVTDELLQETLPFFPELDSISLPMTSVTSKGLKQLLVLPRLTGLEVSTEDQVHFPINLDFEAAKCIASIKTLQHLELCGAKLNDRDFAVLERHPSLRRIVLQQLDITPDVLIKLASIPNIRECLLGTSLGAYSNLSPDGLMSAPSEELIRATRSLDGRLEEFTLHGAMHSDLLIALGKIESVKRLDVNDTVCSEKDIKTFLMSRKSKLDYLSLPNQEYSDQFISLIKTRCRQAVYTSGYRVIYLKE